MTTLHNNRHTLRFQNLHNRIRHFLRQSLLDLQPPCKHLCDSGQFANPNDGIVRNIPNVHLPRERHQMVLAHAEHLDVLDDDHLGVILLENRPVDDIPHVLLVPLCEEQQGIGVAMGCGQDALPIGILTDAFEERAHGALHALEAALTRSLVLLEALAGSNGRSGEAVEVDHGGWGAGGGFPVTIAAGGKGFGGCHAGGDDRGGDGGILSLLLFLGWCGLGLVAEVARWFAHGGSPLPYGVEVVVGAAGADGGASVGVGVGR